MIVVKSTKYIPNLLIFIKSIFASILMSFVLYYSSSITILYQILFGIITYFVVLAAIGGINKQVIKDILNKG